MIHAPGGHRQLEDAIEPVDMTFGLDSMLRECLLELLVPRLHVHPIQRRHQLALDPVESIRP